MSGGNNAVINSQNFIEHIVSVDPLRDRNKYIRLDESQKSELREEGFVKCFSIVEGKPFFTTNVRINGAKNIYQGDKWQLNVFIWHPHKFPKGIAVRCNWQQTTGTTDEKHPFTLISLEKVVKDNYLDLGIFLVDGSKAKESAKNWVRSYTSNHKLLKFTSMSDWANWAKINL